MGSWCPAHTHSKTFDHSGFAYNVAIGELRVFEKVKVKVGTYLTTNLTFQFPSSTQKLKCGSRNNGPHIPSSLHSASTSNLWLLEAWVGT